MKEKLYERISKLLCVKSLVTLMLTVLYCVLALYNKIPQELNTTYLMIIGFYFGTQATKSEVK